MLLSSACPPPCEGADCGGLYPRAELAAFGAARLHEGLVDVLEPDAGIAGADEDGFEWAVVGVADGALLGVPAVGEVRRGTLDSGATTVLVSSGTAGDDFGAAVALGDTPVGQRLLVGAPGAAGGPLVAAAGAVYVYDSPGTELAVLTPTRTIVGAVAEDHFGARVWACGDLDGDTLPDWAAASPWATGPGGGVLLAGAVHLGLSDALGDEPSLTTSELPALHGATVGAAFGEAAACHASLEGDATAELVVGAPFHDVTARGTTRDAAGSVSVWRGGTPMGDGEPWLTLRHEEPGAWFGAAVAIGDLDGDGLPELVVGAPGEDRTGEGGYGIEREDADAAGLPDDVAGAVYVFAGEDVAAELTEPALTADPQPVWELHGTFSRGRFGASVVVEDLDGDGIADLAVGAPGANRTNDEAATRSGAVTVWWGPATNWPAVQFVENAPTTVVADRQYLETGRVLAAAPASGGGASLLVVTRQPSAEE